MISVSSLAKSFGDTVLFEGVSFQLNAGERYGLVGANGSGKTTLLNILAGREPASEGTVSVPSRADLGVLRQDQFIYDDEEILGVAMRGNPELWDAIIAKEALLAEAETEPDAFDAERYGKLEETIQRHDGYAAEARAAEILEGLGIPGEVHRRPMSTLSGGFKLRVLLAQALAGAPDALLLDEPTNHLDILSIRWLEKFLRQFDGPIVVISHDHRFLDNVATHILDVDYRTVTLYHGDYTHFTEKKALERARREKEIEQREKEIAKHQQFVDRFRAKASKARQAQSKLRLIEKREEELEPLPPSSRRYPTFRLEQRRPSGRDVLKVKGLEKSYGANRVLPGVDLEVRRGDRLAIIGPNGIGKSTLLKIIVEEVEADAGSIDWGHETYPGYFAQDHHEQLSDESTTAEQWLRNRVPGLTTTYLRGAMGLVLFSGDEAEKPLSALSGGEAARLNFCRLSLEKPNVLILDEPTNHLDLESIEALVDGLRAFDGTLVFVSHDRWFVGQLADRIIEISPDGLRDYRGTYEEYVHSLGDDHLDADAVVERERKKAGRRKQESGRRSQETGARDTSGDAVDGRRPDNPDAPRPRSRNPYRLRQRRDELEARIDAIEERLEAIERAFADPSLYDAERVDEVRALESERSELQSELEHHMAEWEGVARELETLE
ncbi:MAG: ribosomal protection-like ABC-F family protein [Candidatus Longimicrobiales bacterium M2_2A_002]